MVAAGPAPAEVGYYEQGLGFVVTGFSQCLAPWDTCSITEAP